LNIVCVAATSLNQKYSLFFSYEIKKAGKKS
jgi:hypothetical protein